MRRSLDVAAGIALGACLAACGGDPGAEGARDVAAGGPLPVLAHLVAPQEGYEVEERFAGRVVSRRSSRLGFERGGRLVEVNVDEGDRVEAGALLARLDSRELLARRRELEAQREEAEARLALAGVTSQRRRQLLEQESISPQLRDEALYDAEALEARLAAAVAALESVDVALDLSRLEAPYAGSITSREADEGSIVSPGQTILAMIEDGALELRVGLPPETARDLEPGRELAVEVAGRELTARVHALLDTIEPDTRTVTAILHFEGEVAGLRDGALARVRVERSVPSPGFWLPIDALSESRRGLWSAYAIAGDGEQARVERRELQVLHAEADRAYVRGTLRAGERVVASGVHRLVPGQRVRVAGTAAP